VIDLCLALNGQHVGVMLPIFMDSLKKTADLSDVTLHFVDKGCSIPVKNYLHSIEGDKVVLHEMVGAFKHYSAGFRDGIENTATDCSCTCQWMFDRCGDSEWCFISHFDIEFFKDVLGWYREKCGSLDGHMGQVGSHRTGLVGYRRAAVKQCGVNFSVFSGFALVKDDRGLWVIRHGSDSRCTNLDFPIHGFDVGEMLENNIAAKDWGIFCPTETELNSWRHHLGTGSGHTGDQGQKRAQAMEAINRRGLKPLE
jgi:hypothetical protein